MTFEIFVYRANKFATKLLQTPPTATGAALKIGAGGFITQSLMGICFGKILVEGEKQWRNQQRKSATTATKKSAQPKKNAPSAG
jgi:hypothetical protein